MRLGHDGRTGPGPWNVASSTAAGSGHGIVFLSRIVVRSESRTARISRSRSSSSVSSLRTRASSSSARGGAVGLLEDRAGLERKVLGRLTLRFSRGSCGDHLLDLRLVYCLRHRLADGRMCRSCLDRRGQSAAVRPPATTRSAPRRPESSRFWRMHDVARSWTRTRVAAGPSAMPARSGCGTSSTIGSERPRPSRTTANAVNGCPLPEFGKDTPLERITTERIEEYRNDCGTTCRSMLAIRFVCGDRTIRGGVA